MGRDEYKKFDADSQAFADAVAQGLGPKTTKRADVDMAVRLANDKGIVCRY